MKGSARRLLATTAATLGVCGVVMIAAAFAASPRRSVTSLSWLAGCWVEDLGAIEVVDEWTAPVGHTMLGVSRIPESDSTVDLELRTITDSGGVLELTTVTLDGQSHLSASRSTDVSVEFLDTTHRTMLRFTRDSLGRLELTSRRQIGARERTLTELFVRASACVPPIPPLSKG